MKLRVWLVVLGILGSPLAHAIVIKSVQYNGPDSIEILLDQKIDKNRIQTEYVRDIIQLSIDGASIYPARIVRSNQSQVIQKIFSYQFSPRTVRVRMSTPTASEQYRGRLKIEVKGRTLLAHVIPLASPKVTVAPAPIQDSITSKVAQTVSDPELLKKISDSSPKEPKLLPRVNPVSSFRTVMFWMIAFVGGLGAFALGIRWMLKSLKSVNEGRRGSKVAGFVSRGLARMGLATSKKLIEVVANHHLGPKKTISVVKVQGRMLVLGISNDSISLITELSDLNDIGGLGELGSKGKLGAGTGATSADFDAILDVAQQAPASGVRDRIRAKLERLKPL